MTNLTKLSNLFLVFWLLFIHSTLTFAADLTFTPNAPIVEQGKPITLSVSGTSGEVTWTANKGQIQGTGTQVTYIAPDQPGSDGVMVMDSLGNMGMIKIFIVSSNDSSLKSENANWQVFSDRSWYQAITLSEDLKTLWVGTNGGLEKRHPLTGEIEKLFNHFNGLPHNNVSILMNDGKGGLWVGTHGGGLAHLDNQNQWTIFNSNHSNFPSDYVDVIIEDGSGGLWVGTWNGLVHLDSEENRKVFDTTTNNLPDGWVRVLLRDGHGGLWIGTGDLDGNGNGGLVHFDGNNKWEVFDTTRSPLPHNRINALSSDGDDGVWIGAGEELNIGGLAHLNSKGEWTIFDKTTNSPPPGMITALLINNNSELLVGTEMGLAYLNKAGEWKSYQNLPDGFFIKVLVKDGGEGLWIGTYGKILHLNKDMEKTIFTPDSSSNFPSNQIPALVNDGNSGVWVGTPTSGLIHLNSKGEWTVNRSGILSDVWSQVTATISDDKGGLWVGALRDYTIWGAFGHLNSNGEWDAEFNLSDLGLSSEQNDVTCLTKDGNGGIWVGTRSYLEGGSGSLVHLSSNGSWIVFDQTNSKLPGKMVQAIADDNKGGIWIGTDNGLAHLSSENQWSIFDSKNNSSLRGNYITALLKDESGGLWIGSYDLVYLSSGGEWKIIQPSFSRGISGITSLAIDGKGGLWIGTTGGIAYYRYYGEGAGMWLAFDSSNSNLPDNNISAIASDGNGGAWIGTHGLAHLSFGSKAELYNQGQIDVQTYQDIQTTKRAAILIAGGGTHLDNALWDTTEFISNKLYNVLNKRGFDNDEIYYLTPKSTADFNGDGLEDKNIVDSPHPGEPLTLEDVRATFEWAKSKGKLDTPLYLFFIDHGETDKLQLSKTDKITAPEFKAFLDDYQTATGNDLILLIDACYSGTFSQQLVDTRFRRALISSTNDTKAYFDRAEKQGFSRSFAKFLDKGNSFKEAFEAANQEQQKLLGNLSQLTTGSTAGENQKVEQVPQLNDGNNGEWVRTHYLNNLSTTTGDETLGIESATSSSTIPVGQAVTLTATTSGAVSRAWATVRPPKMNLVLDTSGTPILAYPHVNLEPVQKDSDTWQTTWNDAVYNGDYSITFYTADKDRNIASSDIPLTLTVTGGIDPPTTAQVQIHLEKDRYQRGETFKATLTEDLGWGYDLYAAVLFPDGQNFMTLKNTNELRPLNEAKPWYAQRKQSSAITLFDLTLPADLPTGEYCLYGILSPEQNEVFETLEKGLWVMDMKCFEIL